MCTPYARGPEVCVQKFGNAYQRKEIEKRMTHFKSILPPGSSNDSAKWNAVRTRCALSFHNTRVPSVIVCLMCSLKRVETESHFFAYAVRLFFVQLNSNALYTQTEICVNVTSGCEYSPSTLGHEWGWQKVTVSFCLFPVMEQKKEIGTAEIRFSTTWSPRFWVSSCCTKWRIHGRAWRLSFNTYSRLDTYL